MKTFPILLLTIVVFSCKSSGQKYNPEAVKLNDSAIHMGFTAASRNLTMHVGWDSVQRIGIGLFDKAIAIDSSYISAYWNKFVFQNGLKEYKKSIVTGEQILKRWPKNRFIKMPIGECYDLIGDTITAKKYYKGALVIYNQELDTLGAGSNRYKTIQLQKALDLVLMGQLEGGHAIIKDLYNNEKDTTEKELYKQYINITKKEIIEPKANKPIVNPFR